MKMARAPPNGPSKDNYFSKPLFILSLVSNVVLLTVLLWTVGEEKLFPSRPGAGTPNSELPPAHTETSPSLTAVQFPACKTHRVKEINVTEQRRYFMEQYNDSFLVIGGWLPKANLISAYGIMRAQTLACMTGSIGEIGVHHGRHLVPLTLSALPDEQVIGIDVFENQQLNYDKSGLGDKSAVVINMGRYGVPADRVKLVVSDSTKLTPHDITKLGMPPFRFFSVDGGHSYEVTMSDLKLAAALIRPGGVIALDDFPAMGWPGVIEAFYDFIALNRTIAPFMHVCQKMYLTTAEYHEHYLRLVEQLPDNCTSQQGFHPSRYAFKNWHVCVKETARCSEEHFDELPLNLALH